MKPNSPKLTVVVPCYNEEATLPVSYPLFAAELGQMIDSGRIAPTSGVLFVDDGSSDATWQTICGIAITIDCDGQDDVHAMSEMVMAKAA